MKCKKCGGEMYIDNWNGWRWECLNCSHEGRLATAEEIEKDEHELDRVFRKQEAK